MMEARTALCLWVYFSIFFSTCECCRCYTQLTISCFLMKEEGTILKFEKYNLFAVLRIPTSLFYLSPPEYSMATLVSLPLSPALLTPLIVMVFFPRRKFHDNPKVLTSLVLPLSS